MRWFMSLKDPYKRKPSLFRRLSMASLFRPQHHKEYSEKSTQTSGLYENHNVSRRTPSVETMARSASRTSTTRRVKKNPYPPLSDKYAGRNSPPPMAVNFGGANEEIFEISPAVSSSSSISSQLPSIWESSSEATDTLLRLLEGATSPSTPALPTVPPPINSLRIKPLSPDAVLPRYFSNPEPGIWSLCLPSDFQTRVLYPGERVNVSLGYSLKFPFGTFGQVIPLFYMVVAACMDVQPRSLSPGVHRDLTLVLINENKAKTILLQPKLCVATMILCDYNVFCCHVEYVANGSDL